LHVGQRVERDLGCQSRQAESAGPTSLKANGHLNAAGNAKAKDGRAVFNWGGNKYRPVVWINYDYATIDTRFTGTHAQYDQIDAQTI